MEIKNKNEEKALSKEDAEKKIIKESKRIKIYDNICIFLMVCIVVGIIFIFMLNYNKNEVVYKPIIYLYPTEETQIDVELKNADKITCSYPKYKDKWEVIAKTNGDLTDKKTGKELYSLYYESENIKNYKVEEEGFVVKGEDTAEFLEEKLELLGLNYKEKEEFIVYWLPKLEANKYNYIRFASAEEIESNMPLEITPKPETTIRILMTYKGLDTPIPVKEQKLEKEERKGYTAVEWGGTEIK